MKGKSILPCWLVGRKINSFSTLLAHVAKLSREYFGYKTFSIAVFINKLHKKLGLPFLNFIK
ncbi:hypothetical protein HpBT0202_04460 [Helicobacter pylori]